MKHPKSSVRKGEGRGAVKAEFRWAVIENGSPAELHVEESIADMAVDGCEHADIAASKAPVFVLPADAESVESLVEQFARAIAPMAFREYKQGDCLPRGHEMDTVERVNEMQVWRQRSARSDARKCLRSLGLAPK